MTTNRYIATDPQGLLIMGTGDSPEAAIAAARRECDGPVAPDKVHSVTPAGLIQIRSILGRRHKLPASHWDSHMIAPWAESVEASLDDGGPAQFELSAHESASGEVETHTLSDDGWTAEYVGQAPEFVTRPCTQALWDHVETYGGDTAWAEVRDGMDWIACTREEAEAAA